MSRSQPVSAAQTRPRFVLCLAAAVFAQFAIGCQSRNLPLRNSFRATVYVAGSGSHGGGELWLLNAIEPQLERRIRLAARPVALTFNSARDEVYVLERRTRELLVLNAINERVIGRVMLPGSPSAMVLDPGHTYAYVAVNEGSWGQILKINLPARAITARLHLAAAPARLAINDRGNRLLASDSQNRQLLIIGCSGTELKLVSKLAMPQGPGKIVTLPYGAQAFVLCPPANQVAVVNYIQPALITNLTVGRAPADLALKPDGGELYVSNSGDGTISIIDTSADNISGLFLTGRDPQGLAVSRHGRFLYAANAGSNTVSEFRLSDRTMVAQIPVGLQPDRLAMGPFDLYVYVLDSGSNDVAVVRPGLGAMLTLLPSAPNASAIRVVAFRVPVAKTK